MAAALSATLTFGATANDFNKNFNDSTLRVDFTLGGDANHTYVLLDRQSKFEGWAGRRVNLDKLPYTGNAQITVVDALTNDTIYRNSFSTLFNEWQRTEEAEQTAKSFQSTMLVPLPKRDARITIETLDARLQPTASNTHTYTPGDVLIAEYRQPNHPSRYLHKGGDPKDAIDVVILAEGYTQGEMDKFFSHAQSAVDAMFTHEPFKSRRDNFNFLAVGTPSKDTGVSVPLKNQWRETAFGSHFSTFYSDRYLTTPNVGMIHDALTGVPYEHIIILANTPVYGGGGIFNNYTLTTSLHDNFAPVVVHEFGHSFGGLADEYFYEEEVMKDTYPTDVEPWEPNITTLVDFASKWEPIVKKGTPVPTPVAERDKYPVGVYEGGGYSFKGVYRPADECRMRNNTWPAFCGGCERALNLLIDFYTTERTTSLEGK